MSFTFSQESARCLLCHEASCTNACNFGQQPDKFIRSLRFENTDNAPNFMADCVGCGACERACIHPDMPIRIRELKKMSDEMIEPLVANDVDLSIDFMGVKCENPFFLSSSVVASNYEMCAKALDMGWAGIVFKTVGVYVPDEVSPRFFANGKEGTPFIGFRNLEQISDHSLQENISYLKKLKEDYPSKVIVASIMGQNDEEWAYLAKIFSEFCDIIECNFSCPQMAVEGMGSDVGQNPELVAHYTKIVKENSSVPVLSKMTPNLGNMEIPAYASVKAGADGIAAINTIKSITDINLDNNCSKPEVNGKSSVSGYSGKAVKPIALRFIHDMATYPKLKDIPLSGIGGIESWKDAVEYILLGCGNVQITTAVMQYGYRIIDDLISGMKSYMARKGYKSIEDFRGIAIENIVSADKLDRSTIETPIFDNEKCIGCGRCYLSCYDAGHQAIDWDSESHKVSLNPNCVGCQLCMLVCPVSAISKGKRFPKIR